ncbi:TPA: NAD(P)-binding domain-containing protein [Pseudomonas aeruginosa]|uniref:NAD(P)-binding domain-containing protein n=1 Tax=Pseudomonas TaxID=286 RepID=UPI000CD3CA3B|nr:MULTISPECIES: NAD(P)-binding domain-containing protein [Pseudomonas]MBH9518255.1 NAD(P)-binding domain-containing protein [Pseudomonas aeruginosa]MBI8577283.1 NAD(P)-binding domain-containing protein [Pseudomonas aeruginosa]MBI8804342.1 NAD(P)-binding domain-containing protein [Pseudomonas aeruginosa]MCU9210303.1 NAD(P)-binding domain-containing protein [Pseudomonas aeruginosa]MDA3374398.1 NAD(P)-binding domain-containing protein [Pseudomonas aeruginosa]
MKTVGVLGVGELTEKVVRGLRRGGYYGPIYLSPRNQEKAEKLAKEFGCKILVDNQAVVDAAQILLLGVRPDSLESLAHSVDIGPQHLLVSFVAGASHRELMQLFGTDKTVRSMLSYAAETNNATVVLNPPLAEVEALFSSLGTLVPVDQEEQFELATVAACVNGWLYFLLHDLHRWIAEKGLDPDQSRKLVIGSLSDCIAYAKAHEDRSFAELGNSIATPGTFTALGLEMLGLHQANAAWSAACEVVLDALLTKTKEGDRK